jgi:hypothetical protein
MAWRCHRFWSIVRFMRASYQKRDLESLALINSTEIRAMSLRCSTC